MQASAGSGGRTIARRNQRTSTSGAAVEAVPRRRRRRVNRDGRTAAIFLAPWCVGVILVTLGPLLASLYLSLTNYDLFTAPHWVGIANYVRMFTSDPQFMTALRVTFIYVAVSVPVLLIVALLLAMLLNRGLRGLAIYRTLFYIPTLLGSSVAIAVLWRQVFSTGGIVNSVLSWFGVQGPSWLGDPGTALYTLITLNAWTFGGTMVIFLAGLRQIPEHLYQAARVDGAGPLSRFWHITVPILSPVILFNAILALIRAFQSFTPAYIISGGTGAPSNSTLLYSLYLYQQGFVNYQMGYAAAMAWFLLFIIAGFTAVAFASSRFWVFYGE
jgi:multiple sugar transport system permease protein